MIRFHIAVYYVDRFNPGLYYCLPSNVTAKGFYVFDLVAPLDACPTSSERFMHSLAVVVFSYHQVFVQFSFLDSNNIHLLQIGSCQPFFKVLLFLFRLNPSHIKTCNLQHSDWFNYLCSSFPSYSPQLLPLTLSQLYWYWLTDSHSRLGLQVSHGDTPTWTPLFSGFFSQHRLSQTFSYRRSQQRITHAERITSRGVGSVMCLWGPILIVLF